MHRRVITIAGMLLGCALAVSCFFSKSLSVGPKSPTHASAVAGQPAGDEPQQPPKLNQQWSGWVFGRMMGVSIPGLGSDSTPPPNLFGWN